MENYPKSGENEVVETRYAKEFYRLVEQFDRVKSRAEDPSLPEEERQKAQADIEKYGEIFEKSFGDLDALDKEEQARRIASQSLDASRSEAEQIEQKPTGGARYLDSQDFIHDTPEQARNSEPDYWQKTA